MNNKYPKISIVIPVYGVEAYIEDCLKSVIHQDYKGEIECVIVNDCSPDRSFEIVKQIVDNYIGKICFKLLEHKKNGGLSAARNTGIENSSGDYIYLLDSDDEITSDCFSTLSEPLLTKQYDMVIANYTVTGTTKKFPGLRINGEHLNRDVIADSYTKAEWYQMAVNKLYSAKFIRENNLSFKEGIIHEDELWSAEVASLISSLYAIKDKSTYIYKVREKDSITAHSSIRKKIDVLKDIITYFRQFIDEKSLINDKVTLRLMKHLFYIPLWLSAKIDKKETFETYKECKKRLSLNSWALLFASGFNFKVLLRDFHFVMPISIAKHLYWHEIHLLRKL